MGVEVTIDRTRLQRLLRRRGTRVERHLRERTERVAKIAAAQAPGTMAEFISTRIEDGPTGLRGVVRCDHPAVRFVLDGTRPHLIRPRRAKALHFYVDGSEVFTRLVRHPGTRANNFLGRALRLGR